MTDAAKAILGFLLIVVGGTLFSIISLDMAKHPMYNDLHQHMCFERRVKEPWEVEPLGRIEQVGTERVLVTMGRDRRPVAAVDAYVYGFSMSKREFNHEYKEVVCPSSK